MYQIKINEYNNRSKVYTPMDMEVNLEGSQSIHTKFFRKWKGEFSADLGQYEIILMDDNDDILDSFLCDDIDFI
jgi:hypothetical protein